MELLHHLLCPKHYELHTNIQAFHFHSNPKSKTQLLSYFSMLCKLSTMPYILQSVLYFIVFEEYS